MKEKILQKPKKLKYRKGFKSPKRENGDEYYPNGMFEFNITKMLAFIRNKPSQFPLEKIDVKQYAVWGSDHLNEKTIEQANLAVPIILAEISPGRFNVIDGNHRLEKVRRQGIEKISAYKVMVQQHLPFLTSEKAYRIYIEYWNEKVDNWRNYHAIRKVALP